MITIAKKKSFDKEWVELFEGIELKLDYPTEKQEITIANKFLPLRMKLQDGLTFAETLKDESALEALAYYVRCTIKDWRTIIEGEIKNGLIDVNSGEVIPCEVIDNELSKKVFYPLAKDPELILVLHRFIKDELEFTETDKKKLNSTQESSTKAGTKGKKVTTR